MIKLYTANSIRTAAIVAIAGLSTMALPVLAAPPDACEPWPQCKDDGGGGGEGDEDDRFIGGPGCDVIDGGDGYDWISYNTDQMQMVVNLSGADVEENALELGNPVEAAAGTIVDALSCNIDNDNCPGLHEKNCDVDTVSNVEKVTLTANDDYVFGGDGDEWFGGGRGNDVIHGGGGNDFIGADRGNDVVIGGQGSDKLRGAEHNDEFRFAINDFASGENDIIEDFNVKADCINFTDFNVIEADFDTSSDYGGKGKTDTRIIIQGGGTITAWDVTLGPSDIGCP